MHHIFDFSENVPRLLLLTGLRRLGVLLGFLFTSRIKVLVSRILLGITTLFSTWVFLDIAIWATNAPRSLCSGGRRLFWLKSLCLRSPFIFASIRGGAGCLFAKKHLMFLLLCPVIALSRQNLICPASKFNHVSPLNLLSLFTTRIF